MKGPQGEWPRGCHEMQRRCRWVSGPCCRKFDNCSITLRTVHILVPSWVSTLCPKIRNFLGPSRWTELPLSPHIEVTFLEKTYCGALFALWQIAYRFVRSGVVGICAILNVVLHPHATMHGIHSGSHLELQSCLGQYQASPFLHGRSNREIQCNFEWMYIYEANRSSLSMQTHITDEFRETRLPMSKHLLD